MCRQDIASSVRETSVSSGHSLINERETSGHQDIASSVRETSQDIASSERERPVVIRERETRPVRT